MKTSKIFALCLFCVLAFSTSSTITLSKSAKGATASCCKMKHCCYENKRCGKNADHACCTGKHDVAGCCCKKDACPMPKT